MRVMGLIDGFLIRVCADLFGLHRISAFSSFEDYLSLNYGFFFKGS